MKSICFILAFICLNTISKGQSITVVTNDSTDVCGDTVSVHVLNSQPGYFYAWSLRSNSCTGGSVTPYAVGDTIQITETGVFFCTGLGPSGIPEISNDISVRVLPDSNNLQTLPSPYPFGAIACTPNVTLCIPSPYFENFVSLLRWYKDGVELIGADSSTLAAATDGYYCYSVKSHCTQTFSDSVQLITQQPLPVIAVSQPSPICSGSILNSSVTNNVAGAIYNWEVSIDGGAYTVIGTGNTISYSVPSGSSLNLRAIMQYPCALASNIVSRTIQDILPVISPSGNVVLCSGSSVALTSSAAVAGSYQWNNNGVSIPGATLPNFTTLAPGLFSISATAACGTVTTSPVTVFADPLTQPVITAGGSTTLCAGNNILLSAVTGPGYTYQWKKYGNIIPGATNSTLQTNSAGIYRALITSGNGCLRSSNSITISILPLPAAVITANGPTTFCAGDSVQLSANVVSGYTYQWRKGNLTITGATTPTYTAMSSGSYRVKVTGPNGCSKNSNLIPVSVPCRMANPLNSFSENELTVQPNPSSSAFLLEIPDGVDDGKEISVYDINGRMVNFELTKLGENSYELLVSNPGMYLVVVRANSFYKTLKILKI